LIGVEQQLAVAVQERDIMEVEKEQFAIIFGKRRRGRRSRDYCWLLERSLNKSLLGGETVKKDERLLLV
jgi:hypothetical protein